MEIPVRKKIVRIIILGLFSWGSLFFDLGKCSGGERYSYQPPAICGTPLLYNEALKLYKLFGKPTRLPKNILIKMGRLDAFGKLLKAEVGDRESFWAWNFDTKTYYQLNATLKKIGIHCYVFVEEGQNVSSTVLNNIANEFDTNIYPTDTSIFGSEPNVDGDTRITILLLDIKDGYTGSGGFTAGYYDSRNEYNDPHSNLREMFYMDLNPGQPGTIQFYGTLAHELQHMIHFNQDGNEETWINEGCSTLAEFLCGYGHDSNIGEFLESPDNGLINWGNDLPDYGQVYLFLFYLWEKYGGNSFITQLTQNPENGIQGVNTTLSASGYSDDFNTVFSNWAVANYLDNTSIEGGKYGYDGLNITDFRPEGIYLSNTWNSYPVTSSGSVEHYAADYIKFTDGSNVTFSFNGNNLNDFRVFIIDETYSPQVSSISLDSNNDGTSSTFTSFSSLVMIPMSVSSLGWKSYSYSSEGVSNGGKDYKYYFPYFTEKTGYWTGVAFSNCSTTHDVNINIKLYDQTGTISETVPKRILPPRGQEAFVVSSSSGTIQEGWMLITSDQPLTGLCFFGTSGTGVDKYMADIALIKATATTLHVPHVAQNEEWDTTILICNPNDNDTTATLTYISPEGEAGESKDYNIPAWGSIKIELLKHLNGATVSGGKVEISATQGIAGFTLYGNIKTGKRCYAGISAVEPEEVGK